MKECEKCGLDFEPNCKYGKVCKNCKDKVYEKTKEKRVMTSKPYWERDDFITKKKRQI